MTHKRVIRVVSYEGNAEWVDQVLRQDPLASQLARHRLSTLYTTQGTIRELARVEIPEGKCVACEMSEINHPLAGGMTHSCGR